jgi:HD-GYP domain-containing protein (c-di-GMP phosphodiesterase class II)
MLSDRPYRTALPITEAIDEIKRCSGTQFDPGVVAAFLRIAETRPTEA